MVPFATGDSDTEKIVAKPSAPLASGVSPPVPIMFLVGSAFERSLLMAVHDTPLSVDLSR
jgi:hypothetical protein